MAKTEPRTLPGFMELLPNEQILFDQMKQTIEESYKTFGFLPIDTPIIELAEVLLAKTGGETEKQIYKFEKGDTNLALRFDLTVPLAKYVAKNYGNLSFPFITNPRQNQTLAKHYYHPISIAPYKKDP